MFIAHWADDPFTLAYRALRDFILYDSDVSRAGLLPGNCPDLTDRRETMPVKDNVQDADFPELVILPAGGSSHINRTNRISEVVRRFTLRLAAGQLAAVPNFFPVQWAIWCALVRLDRRLRHAHHPRPAVAADAGAGGSSSSSSSQSAGSEGFAAVAEARGRLLNLPFITAVRVDSELTDTVGAESDTARGVAGWVSHWTVEITFQFDVDQIC